MAPEEGTVDAPELAETPATPVEPQDETFNLQALADEQAAKSEEEPENQEQVDEPEAEQPEEPQAPEFEEIEFEGQRYEVPKNLKSAFMAHKDYTQKTQVNAERVRELDAREQTIAQQLQANDAELDARVAIRNLESQIKPYADLTKDQWLQWEGEDPLAAAQGWRHYEMLKGERTDAQSTLQRTQTERSEQAKSETTKRLQETQEFAKTLPGWSPQVEGEIIDIMANRFGVPLEKFKENLNPGVLEMAYFARLGLKALQKPTTAPAIPPAKPLTTIGAKTNAPVRKSYAEMDMSEYVSARQAEEKAKARR